jgi:hypothetical protein
MKSHLRFSKADGSTKRKVERAIARGWQPGLSAVALARGHVRKTRLDELLKKGGHRE